MKKVFLTAAAVFAFGFANAQETKFGVKAGVNLSNFGGDAVGTSSKIGFQAGGFAEIKVSEKFAIQPEVLFSLQGMKFDFMAESINTNLLYVNIPVVAKFFVAEKFSLEAGPQVGLLLSANVAADGESEDVKDGFETLDFGLNLGLGYDVSENINLGLRYTLGLANIAKDAGDAKVTNTNFALALGYKF